jgi:hypothetical protein
LAFLSLDDVKPASTGRSRRQWILPVEWNRDCNRFHGPFNGHGEENRRGNAGRVLRTLWRVIGAGYSLWVMATAELPSVSALNTMVSEKS